MEITYVVIAFIFGFTVKQVGLPPLVGFLIAGFFLNYLDIEATELLHELSEVGIILLLFSIGLKINIRKLFQPQIWGVATLHMIIMVVFFETVLLLLAGAGVGYFAGIQLASSLLIAFALSFSSTVFAVKILEERGEIGSRHGRLAIGILIMQDFFAVIFITVSKGELPSPLAIGLFGLLILRRPLLYILGRSGHGELLVLLSCILPLAGAALFESVGLKADLGALLLGMLLAGHPKTEELVKAMFGFKDLFLVCFFLTIGMAELPQIQMVTTAFLLLLFIPVKVGLFYVLLTRYALRARTSLLTSLSLANYSEFGLIVSALGVKEGWLSNEWLIIIAVVLSLSMICAAPAATHATVIYSKFNEFWKKFETESRLPEDDVIDIGDATIVVFGMGRIGASAFESLQRRYGREVVGVDSDEERVLLQRVHGKTIIHGDAADYDFWLRGVTNKNRVELVLLTMNHVSNLEAAERIRTLPRSLMVAAIARYEDEVEALRKKGVEMVFNIYDEAGTGFSEHVCSICDEKFEDNEVSESEE